MKLFGYELLRLHQRSPHGAAESVVLLDKGPGADAKPTVPRYIVALQHGDDIRYPSHSTSYRRLDDAIHAFERYTEGRL